MKPKNNVIKIVSSLKNTLLKISQFNSWSARNYAPPSPQFVKEKVLFRHGLCNAIWIETGTYLGTTTKFLAKEAEFVYSIEPEISLYNRAQHLFSEYPNVKIINGTSEGVMSTLLQGVGTRVNFWLDGHYSAGITFQGDLDTPVMIELASIELHLQDFMEIVIFIDDVRCFNPLIPEYSTYPELNLLTNWALKNRFSWTIENDILIMKKDS